MVSTTTRRDAHGGMVTAEAALILPLVAIVVLALVWLMSVGIEQVRVVDAARDAARALARGTQQNDAISAARRTAGSSATVTIRHKGRLVLVTVSQQARPPGWLLVPLPSVLVRAHAGVEVEDDVGF